MKKLLLLILLLYFSAVFYPPGVFGLSNPQEKQLRDSLIKKLSRTFPRSELDIIFSDQRLFLDRSIFETGISPCPGGYFDPNCGILTPESLNRGKKFIEGHRETFNRIFEEYGVEAYVIAAILRVETNIGNYIGSRSVINTLYTRYMLMSSRRGMALEQIEFFLRLAKINQWDPFEIKGSSWGAIGLPQFMPFSYWHFAIDGNKDGKTDLFDPVDAIYSIANYLSKHRWSNDSSNQRAAIWAYNHDDAYVNAVLAYARALKNIMGAGR